MGNRFVAGFAWAVWLAAGCSAPPTPDLGLKEARDEMRRLAAIEDDRQFVEELYAAAEKQGFEPLMRQGSSCDVGNGAVVYLSRPATAPVTILDAQGKEHVVSQWPFVRFVTPTTVTGTPPVGAELADTVVLLGTLSGRILVARPSEGTVSVIDPLDD